MVTGLLQSEMATTVGCPWPYQNIPMVVSHLPGQERLATLSETTCSQSFYAVTLIH